MQNQALEILKQVTARRFDALETVRRVILIDMLYSLTVISGALFPSHEKLEIRERSVGPRNDSDMLRNLLLNDMARSGHASRSLLHMLRGIKVSGCNCDVVLARYKMTRNCHRLPGP